MRCGISATLARPFLCILIRLPEQGGAIIGALKVINILIETFFHQAALEPRIKTIPEFEHAVSGAFLGQNDPEAFKIMLVFTYVTPSL